MNSGPVGLARFSTLRAWLSQWSIDDTNAEGERCAAGVTVPLLAIENTADDAVPQSHVGRLFNAAGSRDKKLIAIKGATHYYVGQPALLNEAVTTSLTWLAERGLGDEQAQATGLRPQDWARTGSGCRLGHGRTFAPRPGALILFGDGVAGECKTMASTGSSCPALSPRPEARLRIIMLFPTSLVGSCRSPTG